MLKIHKTTDPVLRAECEEVTEFDFELQKLVDEMIETMRKKNGVGLAAPQVGVSKKIFICEFEGEKATKENRKGLPDIPLTVLCNPEIISTSEKEILMVEGCLSFPGLEMVIKRPESVVIKGKDRHGNPIEISADGLFARVIQHENDHLNSTLLIDKMEKQRVIFIGTGDLGLPALAALARDSQYEILSVVTGEEKSSSGRKKLTQNPIFDLARELSLPILRTGNIKDPKIVEKILNLRPTLGVMADFGQIIPNDILNAPKYGILNIHPSLLPLHRGPAPVVETILSGDKYAGVTIMKTGEKMDAGPIISQAKVELTGSETAKILKDYLAEYGTNLLLNTIPYYIAGDLEPEEQEEAKATFSKIIKKTDGQVDLTTPAEIVDRKVRAFSEWPTAWIILDNMRIQLISGHFGEDGAYTLDLVKPEGRKVMNYVDFVNGYRKEISFE